MIVTCQRASEGDFPGHYFVNGPPSTCIGVYDSRFTDNAFRKSIFAKTFDLLADALGKLHRIVIGDQSGSEPVLEAVQIAVALPGTHGAPQSVGLTGGEARGMHRQLHDLLLEDRHPEGALQRHLRTGS